MRTDSSRTAPTLLADESGATAIEYGLIAALVAIIIVSGLLVLANSMDTMYSSIESTVGGAMGS